MSEPDNYRDYVLAEIRCASLRLRLLHSDLVTISVALRGGLISTDDAIEHLQGCDVLRLVASSSAPHSAGSP